MSSLLKKGIIQHFDFNKIYFENIKSKIDLELIKNSKLKILYDAMYGSGQNALDEFINIENKINFKAKLRWGKGCGFSNLRIDLK
jgi:phosphomannomutase